MRTSTALKPAMRSLTLSLVLTLSCGSQQDPVIVDGRLYVEMDFRLTAGAEQLELRTLLGALVPADNWASADLRCFSGLSLLREIDGLNQGKVAAQFDMPFEKNYQLVVVATPTSAQVLKEEYSALVPVGEADWFGESDVFELLDCGSSCFSGDFRSGTVDIAHRVEACRE